MTSVREFDFSRGRAAARAGACAWLLLIVWPLWVFAGTGPDLPRVVAVLGGVAVFAACWVQIMWRMLSHRATTPDPLALAGLAGAGLALLPLFGAPWAYVSFVYAVSACAATLRTPAFAASVAAIAGVEAAALLSFGVPFPGVWWVPLVIVVQAVTVHGIRNMGLLVARLDAARAEVARLAVENERLRFARDLHDTLGHTLTAITIRSQLAARLAPADPVRAAAEMGEVEGAARRALDEMRQAVTGYRAASLAQELEGATRNLAVAGIEVTVLPMATDTADRPVPAAAETLLAWSVREAATNVLRHSRARRCRITLRADETCAEVEVVDDGRARQSTGDGAPGTGNGLAGLAERVGAAGGRVEVGPLPGGGYRLLVRVPLEAGPGTGTGSGVGAGSGAGAA
ncbi:sensor histidine kinase [Nonomuraea sp. NPDC049419]|uniref:sensor histidine kinase n=1 Tax=Nonomuraea sp. NPDC049419 TaxID=3155772 RepID=UPI0034376803